MKERAAALADVCSAVSADRLADAGSILRAKYPFEPRPRIRRRPLGEAKLLELFIRDRFTDQYRGTRLVFPGALSLLSLLMPEEFPYHPNGKMDACHFAYWELFPTADHVLPIARGGSDDLDNLVTVSMLTNQVKSGWSLEELGWERRAVEPSAWDGMLTWTLAELGRRPQIRPTGAFRRWISAAKRLDEAGGLPRRTEV